MSRGSNVVCLGLAFAVFGCGGGDRGDGIDPGDHADDGVKAIPVAELPSYPKLTDFTFTPDDAQGETQIGRVEYQGMIRLVPARFSPGELALGVGSDSVDVRVDAGDDLGDVVDALDGALAELGFTANEMVEFRVNPTTNTTNAFVEIRSIEGERPAPERDLGELDVVFRSVEIVERNQDLVDFDPFGKPFVTEAFRPHVDNLQNFFDFGSSGLTVHETRQLLVGLRETVSFSESGSRFRVGDRVQFKDFAGKIRRGIVATASGDSAFILATTRGSDRPLQVELAITANDITGMISPSLIDKKQSGSIE